MATYSINIGTPTESTKVQDLQTFLNKLPDNTAQLISPRDTRDSIFTTWENILIKETTVGSSSIGYIGLDNDTLKAKMFIGKKAYTTQEILDNTLLTSDTDLFIFNGKSDSNPSLQDTKVSFLAGLIPSDYYNAPYIEATKITSPSRIDFAIVNPATAGVIEINADQIELGTSGWIINNTGALYPVIDGQDLGATPSNRIGNLYMASRIDYANDLSWTVGTTSNMVLTTGGVLSVDSISASNIFADTLQITTSATAGYVLTSDGVGNALWLDSGISSVGVTAGYIIVSDGLGDIIWQQNTSLGSGLGVDGSVQFSQGGSLSSDGSNFFWDNTLKRFGINTNTPTSTLDVTGSGSYSLGLSVGSNLSVGNNLNIVATMSSSGALVNDLIVNNTTQFNISGVTAGRILTSVDNIGNATWQDAPITITASGTLNSIQLSDGLGNFINDNAFRWDNTFNNLLKIDNAFNLALDIGAGIQTSGNLLFENNDSFIGWNIYQDTKFKRITSGYSSWITQGSTGSMGLFVSDTGASGDDAGVWNFVGTNITPTVGYTDNGGFEQFSTTSVNGLSVLDTVRITGVSAGIDGIKTVSSIDSVTQFTTTTTFTSVTSVPGGATVELLSNTPAITINNINKEVGIGITPVRDLHVNKYMRLEPTGATPSSPSDGDVYFDNTLNSLMVYDTTGWFKSETKMLHSIQAENMFTKAGTFNGLASSISVDVIFSEKFRMKRFKANNNRNCQFNFVLPDTYISGRAIKVKVHWTLNSFTLLTVSVNLQVGITKGPYDSLDATTEYQITSEGILGPLFHSLPERSFELTFSGTGMTPGESLSVVIVRDSSDSFNSNIYIYEAEVFMI